MMKNGKIVNVITLSITYEKTTQESAENNENSDNGFYVDGWEYSLHDSDEVLKDFMENPGNYKVQWEKWNNDGVLKSFLQTCENLGICEDQGSWFSSVDPIINYQTGEHTRYSFHINGCTPTTYKRIARLLKGEKLFG